MDEKKLLSFQAHGFRVMYLACKLGRRMGVYDADLRLAALLHDIEDRRRQGQPAEAVRKYLEDTAAVANQSWTLRRANEYTNGHPRAGGRSPHGNGW